MVTDRLVNMTNWEAVHANGLTSLGLAPMRTPMHLPSDRQCIEALMPTVGKLDLKDVTVGRIRNTLELGVLALSENLKPEIEKNPLLEIVSPPRELEFDGNGNLADMPLQQSRGVPAD